MFNKVITLENPADPLNVIVTKAHTSPDLDDLINNPNAINYMSIYMPAISDINIGTIKNVQYRNTDFGNFIVVGMYLQSNIDNNCLYQKIELARNIC